MNKPLSQTEDQGIFPAGWVVGSAAAGLVREDEGVLLAQPGPETARQAQIGPVLRRTIAPMPGAPPRGRGAVEPRRPPALPIRAGAADPVPTPRRAQCPSADEIAQLKAEMERLQRRFEAARMRSGARWSGPGVQGGEFVAVRDEGGAPGPVAGQAPRRRLHLAFLVLIGLGLAAGLYQYRAALFQF
jgi:hypothetical protein